MNLQKHIKEIVITLSVISITAGAYATLSNVNTGDALTATLWNNMVADVNSSTDKLSSIYNSSGNIGIGNPSPAGKLDISGIPDSGSVYLRSTGRPFLDIKGGVNNHKTLRFSDGTDGTYRWDFNAIPGNDVNNPAGFGIWNSVTGQQFTMKTNGNVGIGTTIPTEKLEVNGTVLAGNIRTPGSIIINNAAPTTFYQDSDSRSAMIHVNSNIFHILRGCGTNSDTWCAYNGAWPLYLNLENNAAHFGGDVYGVSFNSSSDKRLKKNIKTLNNSIENISKLRGVSFDWKSTGKSELGLIAQEVEEVYPDLVDTDEKGMKSVKYSNLVAPLIESVKELKKENEELKSENQKKDKQIEYILQEIEKLKSK